MSERRAEGDEEQAAASRPGLFFLSVLAALTFVGPLALHFFFPALPAIKAGFQVSESLAQLTVSLPMITMAVLTLAYGSLSDRLGRRPVLLVGLGLFTLGGVLAAVADTIWMLIAARLVQAAGGACGLVLARTIARDVYGTDGLVKAMAYLQMVYALSPMVATPLGGLLVDETGWRALMASAAAGGAIIGGLAIIALKETHPSPGRARGGVSMLAGYILLFRNPRFSAFVFQAAGSSGVFFAMATGGSFLMIDYLHRPASDYGLYFVAFPLGYILGNFIAGRLGGRAAIEPMVLIGGGVGALAVVGQAIFLLSGNVSPLAIFVPGFFVTFGQGLSLPNGQTGAIREAGALAGTAAGIGVFLQMFGASAFSQLYGQLADGTPTPLVIATGCAACLSVAGAVTCFALRRRP